VVLPRLESGTAESLGLSGRYVVVRNGGIVNRWDAHTGCARAAPLGDAPPDQNGDFLFEPGHGGGRVDKVDLAEPEFLSRYVEASRFGEVNTYFHVDRIAAYVDELLLLIGAPSLPRVIAVVTAHPATIELDGVRDGVRRPSGRWFPLQGGHYRLPGRSISVAEHHQLSPHGEIHLGPGWMLLEHGALAEAVGGRYRANASHNAGIIYHEYGHHIARHTVDFAANALRRPGHQHNRKAAIEEGVCDYWAATVLGIPHIWAWHRRHDSGFPHRRALTSAKTMKDYDAGPGADPHANGTIWGAALWDLRTHLGSGESGGARVADLLVLKSLLLLGTLAVPDHDPTLRGLTRLRGHFASGLAALLHADGLLTGGRHRRVILSLFAARGIEPAPSVPRFPRGSAPTHLQTGTGLVGTRIGGSPQAFRTLLKHVARVEIPDDDELHTPATLEADLRDRGEPDHSFLAVGDIMLDGRTRSVLGHYDMHYPFAAVRPLLRRAPVVLGNLEGPFAKVAALEERNHAYRTHPELAGALCRAGVNVVTLANNHLLDCGRPGVLETLEALERAGVAAVGAGIDRRHAHRPAVCTAGPWRIGILGYYWNRRCAATDELPGSAMDPPEALAEDIQRLREQVDRVIVTFHWGIPYERRPSLDDLAKARWAVDCGADVVIGHHPHVLQPVEVYRDRPIFYSVGNFAFGSGNSRAEGLAIGVGFGEHETSVEIYALYVKNRDPRVNYQPKLLRGRAAERVLGRLSRMSPARGLLDTEGGRMRMTLPRAQHLGVAL
jgi:poly-gamma-glutamate capsule biosynthesis protein CapA/YwtB (metallophosphatase superfamily)